LGRILENSRLGGKATRTEERGGQKIRRGVLFKQGWFGSARRKVFGRGCLAESDMLRRGRRTLNKGFERPWAKEREGD